MIEDSLATSHPVFLEIKDPAEISGLFDRVTYSKVGHHFST
jgi:aminopeptidase N